MEVSIKNESNFILMYFKGDYLRVVTPRTEDGSRPLIDPSTGRQMFKETALPVTARKQLEKQNQGLPNHLKKIIELVSSSEPRPIVTKENPVERKKPGPKPKVNA